MRYPLLLNALLLSCLLGSNPCEVVSEDIMRVEIDTTQMSRHLLRSSIFLPAQPGRFAFRHPEWIPGIHGPSEQVRNIAGLTVHTSAGETLEWQRDPGQLARFFVEVPESEQQGIRVELTYLANQPTRVSTGVDSFGNSDAIIVNMNTCIVYPDGQDLRDLPVQTLVKLPAGFQHACALDASSTNDANTIKLQQTTVETLVDSPLIAGRHSRQIVVEVDGFPTTKYHFISESTKALEFEEELEANYVRLMEEAFQLFGSAPFEAYDFLVVCSDKLPGMGLEHHASSLNGIDEEALVDEDKRKGRAVYLLAHELVHAWCGKYRRPAGMYRPDFHSAKKTGELWIYEGLTQYLGHVLTVRAGMLTFDEHRQRTAGRIGSLANRSGRQWRPLEDTAVAAYTLRGGSPSWTDLRRSQDYYDEGAFFWLEADALIRKRSDGKKSLDDFCQAFFQYDENFPKVKPFEMDEVVSILSGLVDVDWAGLIQRRIRTAQAELSLECLRRAGYEFTLVREKSDYITSMEKARKYIAAEFSLGLGIENEGEIRSVIPNGVGDAGGLADGMKILGVNGMKFNAQRLENALEASESSGEIEFLVEEGEAYQTLTIKYEGGPKYPAIVATGESDLFEAICKPRATPTR